MQVGTPLCIPSQGGMDIGRIASMELNHKAVDVARAGDSVAMKIEATKPEEATRLYGRHFDHKVLAPASHATLSCVIAKTSGLPVGATPNGTAGGKCVHCAWRCSRCSSPAVARRCGQSFCLQCRAS